MEKRKFDLTDEAAAAFCPSCGAGYGAGSDRCADCGRELLSRSELEEILATAFLPEEDALEPPLPEEPPPQLPELDLSDLDAAAFCLQCGSGYRAGTLVCVDCEVELRPRSWVEARRETVRIPAAESVLADIDDTFKAHVLGSALTEQGVWFLTRPLAYGALRFLVRPADLDLAREVLSDIDRISERGD